MVARAEIDMLDIKAQFLKMYNKTLYSFIKVRSRQVEAGARLFYGAATRQSVEDALQVYTRMMS